MAKRPFVLIAHTASSAMLMLFVDKGTALSSADTYNTIPVVFMFLMLGISLLILSPLRVTRDLIP